MPTTEQNRKTEANKMERESTEFFAFVWGWPQEQRGSLTLKQTPMSSLTDRRRSTAGLKWWPSRRKNSSGSYNPAKGVVRNTGVLNVSITNTALVLFCLTGVSLATQLRCWAGTVQILSTKNTTPPFSHQSLWHLDLFSSLSLFVVMLQHYSFQFPY